MNIVAHSYICMHHLPLIDPAKPKTQSQLIIQKNFDKLHQNINLKSLQPHLEASSLLTKQLSEHLQLPGLTDHEKKTTLLSHLLHNHEDCIGELIQCLRKADDHLPHQELAKMLENQPDQLEVCKLFENEPISWCICTMAYVVCMIVEMYVCAIIQRSILVVE